MSQSKIFVVDDERILRISIADDLRDAGHTVFEFANAAAALSVLNTHQPDIIITDIKMPGMDGIEFLQKIKDINSDINVIVITANATVESAIKAMKLGAYDYLIKPFVSDEILLLIERINEYAELKKENKVLKQQIASKFDFSNFIGSEVFTNEISGLIQLILNNKTTVLLHGQTGTGKELITNIIHHNSNRKGQPLVKVSCAILSKDLFESELFGHIKGAFTGAEKDKAGRFELADKGTLYLDDIDDMPLDLQVKLLRVLEEGEIERVGSSQTIKIDVRIIASTKVDLRQKVDEGKFREDLYYRINVFPINILPLRERKNDIKYLCDHFYTKYTGLDKPQIAPETYTALKNYHFPGNVRELRNIMERLVIFARGNTITPDLLPGEVLNPKITFDYAKSGKKSLTEMLDEIELSAIKQALERCGGNKSKAAEFLGIPLSTLRTKMEKFAIN